LSRPAQQQPWVAVAGNAVLGHSDTGDRAVLAGKVEPAIAQMTEAVTWLPIGMCRNWLALNVGMRAVHAGAGAGDH
jgi:hypothetical protein